MTQLQINLDQEAMAAALQQAVLGVLPIEAQKQLVAKAVLELLTEKSSGYGSEPQSQFQRIINEVLRDAMMKAAERIIASDDALAQQIDSLVADAVLKVKGWRRGTSEWDGLTEKMSRGLVDVFNR